MNKVLFSSLSKKFVMALAGIFIILFLPVHLGINLQLLRREPETFNKAAHFMATFPVIRVIEVTLFLSILVHITWGIIVQIKNWLSRPIRYAKPVKTETVFFSRFMIWTGACILTFFVIHFFNFFFIRLGIVQGNPEDFYTAAHKLFKIPLYDYIYLACFALLGLHLFHAFSSAFQTLGLTHRIWRPVVDAVAWIYAIAIPIGFATIAIILWQFR
ncbi:MAG: succinate dehydrogenase cytochrome b subunit [Bacteroidales bacterium]